MYKRIIDFTCCAQESCFLWGPRQTGKSTLLKMRFPGARYYDLLLSDVYRRLLSNPAVLREEIMAAERKPSAGSALPIIIDEVQKVPDLLDEIHWLIENRHCRFILCGSSARKLKRKHANLLGGRALRMELHPLVFPEIPGFSLEQALNRGLLPRHYQNASPRRLIQAYVGDYLKEEIAAEALTRNIPAFSRFLEVAALSNGEIINFNNIASECGVSAPTVKGYYEILEDTLIGRFLPAFVKRAKRRLIGAPKFFLFDVGVVAQLARRGQVETGSELFGKALEHYLYMELHAHTSYSGLLYPLAYWRTASQFEVDFIMGEEVAVEVKSTSLATDKHLKGLRAFKEEYPRKQYLLVTRDAAPRRTADGIDILPWQVFLERLWDDKIIR
jgi:predicted AAA+ superfamily ATPase